MRHIAVHNKKNQKVLVHVEDLKEAFPAADNKHTVLVIRVADRDKGESFLIVNESTNEIYQMLRSLQYENLGAKKG